MSCNRAYVIDEEDDGCDKSSRGARKKSSRRGDDDLVPLDCVGNYRSLSSGGTSFHHQSCSSSNSSSISKSSNDTTSANSEESIIPSSRRIQTVIWQAVLRLGRQDVDGLFWVVAEDEDQEQQQPFSQSSCYYNTTANGSIRATTSIHPKRRREYNAAHLLGLSPDSQIHILSYLHPRDVLTTSCCDHRTQNLIHGDRSLVTTRQCSSTSALIWFTLWVRDYGWVLREWNIGLEAIQRSYGSITSSTNDNTLRCPSILAATLNMTESDNDHLDHNNPNNNKLVNNDKLSTSSMTAAIPSMKEFYLIFSLTWQNYCIAGHSTMTSCLTGIHGHVFDMTNFLPNHPGSPDSLIIHGGGKDATAIFESVGHSIDARKIAWNRCALAVDLGCCSSSSSSSFDNNNNNSSVSSKNKNRTTQQYGIVPFKTILKEDQVSSLLPRHRSSKPRMPGNLRSVRNKLQRGIESARRKAVQREARELANGDILGNINVYFDPICQRWKGWHLDMEFCPVFLHDL